AEVLQPPAAVVEEQPGVPVGGVVVIEHQGGAGRPADQDRRGAEGQRGAVQRTGGHPQPSRPAPAGTTGGASAAVGGGLADHAAVRQHAGAEHIPAQHADSGEHQQPEHGKIAHLHHDDDQVAHRRRSPPAGIVSSGPEQDAGTADGQRVAVHQGGGVHVVALDVGVVRGAEVGGDHPVGGDADLQVAPGDAGVVDDDVRLSAAADHCDRAGEQVALTVDVDDRVPAAGLVRGGGGHGAAAGGGPYPEPARLQVVGGVELHLHRADEHILLAGGVVGGGGDHLLGHRLLTPVPDLLVVLVGQLHGERVRHHGAATGECGGALVHVSPDGAGDLHG